MITPRDEMKAALECREPQHTVPLWDLHFHCWNQASGRHFIVGGEFAQLSAAEQERAVDWDAELMVSVIDRLGLAGVTIPDNYWEIAPGAPTYYWLPRDGRLALARTLQRLAGDRVLIVSSAGGIIGMPGAGNYEAFCYKLFDAPEEIDEQARRSLTNGLADAQRLRDAGVDAVYTGADLADNHGPFFNPAQMERFVFPYMRQWAAGVKALGLYAITHTDGDIMPILDQVASSGIHALQAIDPVAGMDMRRVKQQVGGRICLCGNVDCGLLVTGPEQAIYDLTRDLVLDCKDGGGFVLGASNAVFHETPSSTTWPWCAPGAITAITQLQRDDSGRAIGAHGSHSNATAACSPRFCRMEGASETIAFWNQDVAMP